MALTTEQLAARRRGIGASDVPAILGEDPYRTRHDVFAEKVYGVAQDTNEAAELGNYLEDGAIRLGAAKLQTEASTDDLLHQVDGTAIWANLDAFVIEDDQRIPLEAKAVGILNPMGVDEQWGDEWSADIPDRYVLQLTAQMMAVGAPHGYLTAIIGGRGHRIYRVPFIPEIAEIIRTACEEFWALVEAKTPPEDWAPTVDTLARLNRIKGDIVRGGTDLASKVIEWKRCAAAQKEAEDANDHAKSEVIAMLADAEGALLEDLDTPTIKELADAMGTTPDKAAKKRAVKYFEQSRCGIDTDKLKKDYPQAYKACQKSSTFRVLRLSNIHKGFTITRNENEG